METKLSKTGSLVLFVLICSMLVLPAWGASLPPYVPFQQKIVKVAIVAQSGGDYTSPVDAMNDYAKWCGSPSAANPCLLKIMPGIYSIGASTLVMREYIDFEGSGEDLTVIEGNYVYKSSGEDVAIIQGNHVNETSSYSGVINGANNAELRFLTVRNTGVEGSGGVAIAIYNNSASPKLTNVTATVTGKASLNYGVKNEWSSSPTITNTTINVSGGLNNIGVDNSVSSPTINNTAITASGGSANFGVFNGYHSETKMMSVNITATDGTSTNIGIASYDFSSTLMNVTVTASGGDTSWGIHNVGGTVKINHSVINGTTNTIFNRNNQSTTMVGSTQLNGGGVANNNGGTLTCAGVYDKNFTFYASSCP